MKSTTLAVAAMALAAQAAPVQRPQPEAEEKLPGPSIQSILELPTAWGTFRHSERVTIKHVKRAKGLVASF